MKYGARLSWGIVIYAIIYLFSNGLSIYGVSGLWAILSRLLMLVIVSTVAGRSLGFKSWKDILPYSIFWAFTVICLDVVFTMIPFSGMQMYSNVNIWIGYALVALLPLAAPQTKVYREETRMTS